MDKLFFTGWHLGISEIRFSLCDWTNCFGLHPECNVL